MSLHHVEIDCLNNRVVDLDTGKVIGGVDKWEMRDDIDRYYGRSIRVTYQVYIVPDMDQPPREPPTQATATVEQAQLPSAVKAIAHEK